MKTKNLSFMIALLVMCVGLSEAKAVVVTDSICNGTSITIGYSYPSGVWYLWNTGATTIQITVAPTITTTYTVNVLNASFAIIAQDTFNIIIKPVPSIWITGPAIICPGDVATLVAHGATTYQWNTGATTIQITVAPTTTTTYTVNGWATNGCSATASFLVTVQALPLPYTITGNTSYCYGQQGSLISLNGSESDCWYKLYKNGMGIANVNGTGYPISFGSQLDGTYTISGFKNTLGCSTPMNGTLVVTASPLPLPAGTIYGNPILCQNTNATFSTPALPYATSYIWSVPTGAFISSGQGTTMITVDFTGASSGNVAVFGQNTCGSGQASFLAVTINQAPSLTITTPNSNLCVGTSTTLHAMGTGTTFLWSTNETTQTITVSPTVTTNYSVVATGMSGCLTTASITINIQSSPSVSLTLVQDNFCTDVNSAILSGGSPAGGIYTGECVFYGTTVYPPVVGVGTYLVTYTYTNGFGCSASATDLLTINPVPAVMFTNVTTGVRTDTPAFDLMTYVSPTGGIFSGPGMIGSFFHPAMAGSGTHMISYTYTHPITGCSATQIQYIPVGPLGVDDISLAINAIDIFPNPAINQLNLRGVDSKKIQSIRIVNTLGKVVYATEAITHDMHLDISGYASGMYIISFMNTEGISLGKRFVKMK